MRLNGAILWCSLLFCISASYDMVAFLSFRPTSSIIIRSLVLPERLFASLAISTSAASRQKTKHQNSLMLQHSSTRLWSYMAKIISKAELITSSNATRTLLSALLPISFMQGNLTLWLIDTMEWEFVMEWGLEILLFLVMICVRPVERAEICHFSNTILLMLTSLMTLFLRIFWGTSTMIERCQQVDSQRLI